MLTFKRILCPVDFSSCSDQAVRAALDLAERFGATVELLHVMQTTAYVMPLMPMGGPPLDYLRDLPERLQTQLDHLRDRLTSEYPLITTCLREGVVHATVVGRANELHADLIVIGTHGHTGLTHLLLGSVAERVVRLAPCPVLTVGPRGLADSRGAVVPPRKVVCPVDFSAPSLVALDHAVTFARATGAELHITHVVPLLAYAVASKEAVDDPGFETRIRKDITERLEALKAKFGDSTLNVTVSSVDGAPYEGIQRVADQQHATLIVIGTHGHTGLDRFLLGSVAEKVVRTSHVPVLAVRPSPVAG
jgi:nucleotide-binding universal stress UspA family protein